MDQTALQDFMDKIHWLFNPEPDEDGIAPREFPNKRITEQLKLDMTYMESFDWEGSSVHKYTRLCPTDEQRIHVLTRNQDVPDRLFGTALRLYADSIIEYHDKKEREGELRFYPPVILTFWAGFETFVRHSSELLIATANSIPVEVVNFLSEKDRYVDRKGEVSERAKYQGVLDRYAVFLRYAYNYEVNKGDKYWQDLEKAKRLRDYYTHLDVSEPRSISSQEVLSFMESILLAIIVPSSKLQRTLMLGVYWVYDIWTTLHEYHVSYEERPLFLNWHLKEEYLFHCNFENVDRNRFKSMQERLEERSANAANSADAPKARAAELAALCPVNDMQVIGKGNTTYILLSGIEPPSEVSLGDNVLLLPADTSHLDFETALATCKRPDDIAVVAAFIPRITAQFKIHAPTSKELAAAAWNASWDALLLSAIFNTEIGFNLQSDAEASCISAQTHLHATNLHFHGIFQASPYKLNESEIEWVRVYFEAARQLLRDEKFQTAVHCLASYRWHSMPRIKMAVLWAGIEGMFGASSEIRFRISLYISRFLHPENADERKVTFNAVKKLYNSRSSAVHGSKVKSDLGQAVNESAELLRKIVRKCIESRAIPREEDLAP